MPNDAEPMSRTGELPAQSARSIDPGRSVGVLSAAPSRAAWYLAAALGAMLGHGLILATLFNGRLAPADQAEPATVEMIEVPIARQAEPDPAKPPEPDPVPDPEPPAATVAEAAAPLPSPEQPPVAQEAEPPPPDPAPEPSRVAEQVAAAEPPDPPAAEPPAAEQPATEQPAPEQPAPVPEVATAAPKVMTTPPPLPARAMPRPIVPRKSGKATALAEAAEPKVTAAVAMPAARPPASGSAASDRHVEGTLIGRIRNAVQAAAQCPATARMMRQSGKAGVAFDYRDGAMVGGVQVAQSSGLPVLDAAALSAVRTAHYPEAPPEEMNRVLHLLVWVEEPCGG